MLCALPHEGLITATKSEWNLINIPKMQLTISGTVEWQLIPTIAMDSDSICNKLTRMKVAVSVPVITIS